MSVIKLFNEFLYRQALQKKMMSWIGNDITDIEIIAAEISVITCENFVTYAIIVAIRYTMRVVNADNISRLISGIYACDGGDFSNIMRGNIISNNMREIM